MKNKDDLIGQKYGELTVIKEHPSRKYHYICQCDCGNTSVVMKYNLLSGHTSSCGRCKRKDLIGKKTGRLTVIKPVYRVKGKGYFYECKCDCGKTIVVARAALNTQVSCGCLKREKAREKLDKKVVGRRFGQLTVIKREADKECPCGQKLIRYICKCDCGNTTVVNLNSLRGGKTKSCGCISPKGRKGSVCKYDDLIMEQCIPDKELSEQIGVSTRSIWARRAAIRKKQRSMQSL